LELRIIKWGGILMENKSFKRIWIIKSNSWWRNKRRK
jgi:hypothetical protein